MKQAALNFVLVAIALATIAASIVTTERMTRRLSAVEQQLQRFEEQQYGERLHVLETHKEP